MSLFKKWLSAIFPFLKKKEHFPDAGSVIAEPEPVPMPVDISEVPVAAIRSSEQETEVQEEEEPGPGAQLRDVSWNRTLIALPLSALPAQQPESVMRLENIEDVFAHYRPQADIVLDKDGHTVQEHFVFNALDDFRPGRIIAQSSLLRAQQDEAKTYRHMQQQLSDNKVLRQVLEAPENKKALIGALQYLVAELGAADANDSKTI